VSNLKTVGDRFLEIDVIPKNAMTVGQLIEELKKYKQDFIVSIIWEGTTQILTPEEIWEDENHKELIINAEGQRYWREDRNHQST